MNQAADGLTLSGAGDHMEVLSTLPAQLSERRIALVVVLLSIVFFIATAPFAKLQLAKVPAFIPIYQSALFVTDLITAMLLFTQLRIVRSPALLAIACAYLFTASITVLHTISFPGLFSETGIGAGAQTTAWVYMFWHGVFPLFVIAYALLKRYPRQIDRRRFRFVAFSGVVGVIAFVAGIALLVMHGHDLLPAIMVGNKYTPVMIFVVGSVWTLSLVALLTLWWRKPHTMLDLWLMVVMWAWLFDIALAAVLNGGRFDLGFYAGRIYGLLASSFVLIMLLFENSVLYYKVAERNSQVQTANKELEAFSYSVSHDLRAPLRAMDGFSRILEQDYGHRLDIEGRALLGRVHTAVQRMTHLIDDLLEFSRLGRQPVSVGRVSMDDLVRETIDELMLNNRERSIDFSIASLGAVRGDRALLTQALINLLSNAIKFTGKTSAARIEVGCQESANSNMKTFYVKDNGAGFDMQYADKLFGVFQRFHSPNEFEGTGVGLAIVQRVISRHGGVVWAQAKSGEGATFYFTLHSA